MPSGGAAGSSPGTAPSLLIGDDRMCVLGYWYSYTVGEAIERIQREYREDRLTLDEMDSMIGDALYCRDPWARPHGE
jgi:hypothetical protein